MGESDRASDEAERAGEGRWRGLGPPVQLPNAPTRPVGPGEEAAAVPGAEFLQRLVALGGFTFSSLRHRDFRLFFYGQILSLAGTWMQSTAQGWLVLELTDSEFLLGLVTAAGSIPILLLTLYAGVLADRHPKRDIILTAQAGSLVLALALAVLTDTGRITIGWILVLVFALGVANAFEIPARQSFFVELVGRRDLVNAIALNSSAFNLSRVVGPALAGILIGSIGIAACFYANALSFIAVIAGLLAIPRGRRETAEPEHGLLRHLGEGFGFIWYNTHARTVVLLVSAASIFAFPYAMLLPVFARDILQAGPAGLGLMLSATGAGALVGGLGAMAAASRVKRGELVLTAAAAFAVLLILFTFSRSLPLSLVLLALSGLTVVPFTANANALVQTLVPDELRGRVMGVYVFMFLGMSPLGSLQAGAVASWIGAPAALAASAFCFLLAVLVIRVTVPELRDAR